MSEGLKSWLNPLGLTKKVLGAAGKAAMAGGEVVTDKIVSANDRQHRDLDLEDIHSIMFSGATLTPGGPLPPVRNISTHPLDSAELKRFNKARKDLLDRGVVLPGYINNFARRFYNPNP